MNYGTCPLPTFLTKGITLHHTINSITHHFRAPETADAVRLIMARTTFRARSGLIEATATRALRTASNGTKPGDNPAFFPPPSPATPTGATLSPWEGGCGRWQAMIGVFDAGGWGGGRGASAIGAGRVSTGERRMIKFSKPPSSPNAFMLATWARVGNQGSRWEMGEWVEGEGGWL